jgi:glycosyltransferase involved in cell wall biosynthesis
MVLPAPPETPLTGVAYHCYRTATNPIRWDDGVDDAIRAGVDTVAFFVPPGDIHGQTLMRLRGLGVRRVLLCDRRGARPMSPLRIAVWKQVASWRDRLLRGLGLAADDRMTVDQCRAVLAQARPRVPAADVVGRSLRIAHFVTALNSGGAERQACYAAIGQCQHGHEVRLLTRLALVGEDAHYLPLLRSHGITARFIGSRWDAEFLNAWHAQNGHANRSAGFLIALRKLPSELGGMVVDLLGELVARPVDVLHCYVDDCNIVGAIAGCLAGVPAIILSFRNGNPTNFPGLLRPWMRAWYQAVVDRPGVLLSANAAMGARDYEQWLGLPAGSVPVIRNAFHQPPVPGRETALAWRRDLGIPAGGPLVAGVFRLQPEKRPLYFLECVQRLRELCPNVRVVLAGVGELESQVRRRIEEARLGGVITLLGQRHDVPLILAASDILLLVSDWEGTPNVLLEAQHCGCVPVATDAGGTRESMAPGETGLLVGLNDLDGTAQAVADLLADDSRRRQMAVRGPAFVASRFAPAALYSANLNLYHQALTAR